MRVQRARTRRVTRGWWLAAALLLVIAVAWGLRAHRLAIAGAGAVAALAVGLAGPRVVESRNPCFRTHAEIERVLRLPILASCSSRGER